MRKIKYLYTLLLITLCNLVAFATDINNLPAPPQATENSLITGGSTGGGTSGLGGQATPIDMYVYILAVMAVVFIIAYANKMKKSVA